MADAVLVGIDEGLETGAVAVEDFGHGIVVSVVAVGDVEPNVFDRHVGMDDKLVARAANGIAVGRGEEDRAGRRGRVIVEDLREGLVERRGVVRIAVEVGAGPQDMEPFAQAGPGGEGPVVHVGRAEARRARVVVVREKDGGRRVEVGHAERGHHVFLAGHLGGAARPLRGRAGFVETDLVGDRRAGSRLGQLVRRPPVFAGDTAPVKHLRDPRGAAPDSARALGEAAIDRVVDKGPEAATDRVAFGPDDHAGSGLVELQRLRGGSGHGGRRVVINEGGMVTPIGGISAVHSGRSIVDRAAATNAAHVGFRTGRSDLAARGVLGREFFGELALDERRLLITHPDIAEDAGRMIAIGRVGVVGRAGAVEIDAAVEFEPDIFRRAIGTRENGEVAGFDHGDRGPVAVSGRRGADGIAAVGQTVGVEADVAVRTVAACHGDARHFLELTGRCVRLVERDRGYRPEGGKLRRAPAENVVAARRDDDGAEFSGVFVKAAHERAARAFGVLVEIGAGCETGGERARLTLGRVVVEHRDHGDFLGSRAVARVAEFVAVVAALVGHEIAVGPTSLLQTAGEIIADFENVGDARVAELAEELGVGMARESAAGLAERGGFVIAIRVNQTHALAEHVVRMLKFFLRGVIVVVAVGVGHAEAGREAARAGSIQPGHGVARVAQDIVQLGAQVIVDQTHARVEITAVTRRLAEVFAEDHGVVAASFFLEDRVAVVGIAEAARAVELPLHLAEVTGVAGVFVRARLRAEEVSRHVLDRVEAQTVGFQAVDLPARRALEVSLDILDVGRTIFEDVGLGVFAQSVGRSAFAQGRLGPVDQPAEINGVAVFVSVILLRTVEVANKAVFRVSVSLAGTEVQIVAVFLRDVDEVGQSEILHLPRTAPIARVVPLAVKAVLGFAQVEVLRHHAGIGFRLTLPAGRGIFIEARDIEGPVVHDVVEINADAEAVRHFHHVLQVGLGAVACAHRAALILLAEVERIPHVIADGESARAFGRRRQPERTVACLGQLRHLAGDFVVRDVEKLEQALGTG